MPEIPLRPLLRASVCRPASLVRLDDPAALDLAGIPVVRDGGAGVWLPGVQVELTAGLVGTALARLRGWEVVHPEDLLDGDPAAAVIADGARQSRLAVVRATAAAGALAGWNVCVDGSGVLVVDVDQLPHDRLVPGDVIVGLDGQPVATTEDLAQLLAERRPGQVVELDVLPPSRERGLARVPLLAARNGRAQLGVAAVTLDERLAGDVRVDLHDPTGGGPSGGLAIALALLRMSGHLDTLVGDVCATAELRADGRLLAVGGLEHKAIACARAGIPTLVVADQDAPGLDQAGQIVDRLVLARDLSDAVAALTD